MSEWSSELRFESGIMETKKGRGVSLQETKEETGGLRKVLVVLRVEDSLQVRVGTPEVYADPKIMSRESYRIGTSSFIKRYTSKK